jgi:hypothetical protein
MSKTYKEILDDAYNCGAVFEVVPGTSSWYGNYDIISIAKDVPIWKQMSAVVHEAVHYRQEIWKDRNYYINKMLEEGVGSVIKLHMEAEYDAWQAEIDFMYLLPEGFHDNHYRLVLEQYEMLGLVRFVNTFPRPNNTYYCRSIYESLKRLYDIEQGGKVTGFKHKEFMSII